MCLSTGGPATSVIWSKDSFPLNMEDYVNSQIIINSTSATYENRLQIVKKSSDMAGNYTCEVQNSREVRRKILYIEGMTIHAVKTLYIAVISRDNDLILVCRDMELRFSVSHPEAWKCVLMIHGGRLL